MPNLAPFSAAISELKEVAGFIPTGTFGGYRCAYLAHQPEVSRTSWGLRITPTPAPRPQTLLAEQPMLMSIMSGWNSSSMRAAHSVYGQHRYPVTARQGTFWFTEKKTFFLIAFLMSIVESIDKLRDRIRGTQFPCNPSESGIRKPIHRCEN